MSKPVLQKIESFIGALADDVKKCDIDLGLKIEAAKVLSSYYASLKKAEALADSEADDEEITISGLQDQLAKVTEASNGGTVPRHKRRRPPADAN